MTETRTVTEAEELEEYRNVYSDFHKEAYGFRPRHSVKEWTIEDFRKAWEVLRKVCEQNAIEQDAREAAAIVEVEASIVKLMETGAKTREDAIRWLHEANDSGGDNNYLCFLLEIPYGYFSPKVEETHDTNANHQPA